MFKNFKDKLVKTLFGDLKNNPVDRMAFYYWMGSSAKFLAGCFILAEINKLFKSNT